MSLSIIQLREDIYQSYHPFILEQLNKNKAQAYQTGSITLDRERAAFMFGQHSVCGERVLDIGANQGYLTVESALQGAESVDAFESNDVDGAFLSHSVKLMPQLGRVNVKTANYDFNNENNKQWNCVICLNVLHHIGRYFDNHIQDLTEAKVLMGQHLKRLLSSGTYVWLQLGFNWQGNTNRPMFINGTKREMTDFVSKLIEPFGKILVIGIYNARTNCYEQAKAGDWGHFLWKRTDSHGEFANRPIYLIRSMI